MNDSTINDGFAHEVDAGGGDADGEGYVFG